MQICRFHLPDQGARLGQTVAGTVYDLTASGLPHFATLAALLHGDVRRDAMNLDAALATLRAGVGRQFCSRVTPLFFEVVADQSERLQAASSADPATGQIQLVAPATTTKLEPVGAPVDDRATRDSLRALGYIE